MSDITPLHTTETILENRNLSVIRMKVPNGWLYTTAAKHYARDGVCSLSIATTLVPDSEDTKEVVAPEDHPFKITGHPGAYRFQRHDNTWSITFSSIDSCHQGYEFEYPAK